MAFPRRRWVRALVAGAGGVGVSLFKLALHCRAPASEACVWGKAYLPLSLPIEGAIFGAGIFVLLTLMKPDGGLGPG